MNQKVPTFIGIFLGALYGLFIRVLLESKPFGNHGGIVTISFMFFVPLVIGFIRVHFELMVQREVTYKKMAFIAWQPIFIFLFVSFFTLLEGSICIVMALPAFLFFSSLGGWLAGIIHNYFAKKKNTTLVSIIIFPLLMTPLEQNLLVLSKTYKVENTIKINAPPNVVWSQLTNVKSISNDEWKYSLTSFIGIPKPVEAKMDGMAIGAVRTSVWEKGVEFKEKITDWKPNVKMSYSFDIDPQKIPDSALDKHVKMGGKYFSPLTGGYFINEDDKGNTLLKIETTLRDNTHFGIYSRIWGEIIFRDFHNSLLKLMKSRSEKKYLDSQKFNID